MHHRRWRERDRSCLDQVANGPDRGLDLTPVSDGPAMAVRDAWLPFVSGQEVPLIWERVAPHDPCDLL